MMLTSFANRSWERRRFPFDESTQEYDLEAEPDVLAINGCTIQPGANSESLGGREADLVAWTILQPSGHDVLATDFGFFDGLLYRVSGTPQRWVGPSVRTSHDVVLLERWEG